MGLFRNKKSNFDKPTITVTEDGTQVITYSDGSKQFRGKDKGGSFIYDINKKGKLTSRRHI